MSCLRQHVRSLACGYPDGFLVARHAHAWDQLVFAAEGVMSVQTDQGAWVVPPRRAVWIPAGVEHEIRMAGSVRLRTLYFQPGLAPLPGRCAVLAVSSLLRELIVRAVSEAPLGDGPLLRLILDELEELPVVPLHLPMPVDPRARRVAERILRDPGDPRPLDRLAEGASRRTLERHFRQETGLTFGQWRTQARLLRALRLLAAGESVTRTGLEVGYESTSAFVAMFKRALGRTPGRYYEERDAVALRPGS